MRVEPKGGGVKKALQGLLMATCIACGSNDPASDDPGPTPGGEGSGGAAVVGSSGTAGSMVTGAGGVNASTGSGGAAGAAGPGGAMGGSGGAPIIEQPRPGCGLSAAAFCDTFDAPSVNRGRAGEMDALKWSGGRTEPMGTPDGQSLAIGPATISNCRAGLPGTVMPPNDALVCDKTADVASNHLLVAVAAQNYGQNSYRIRQPFDFAGRTGKIVFDGEAFILSSLLGWISVAVTEDPISVPSFATLGNYEGGVIPRNGFTAEFERNCGPMAGSGVSLGLLNIYKDYKGTNISNDKVVCLPVKEGKIHHFELTVSQTKIEVYGTPFSDDGVKFEAPKLLYTANVDLSFTRGYVSISVHNHATIKYSHDNAFGATHPYDAWVARWDNVGFDGPVIANWREYEAPDALVPWKGEINTGYIVADAAKGPNATLHFRGVKLDGAESARLAFLSWYVGAYASPAGYDQQLLKYRLNGGAWKDRPLTAAEIGILAGGKNTGVLAQSIDVPLADLGAGDNTLEFVSQNISQGYPLMVANVDLVLGL
jgi:hypothetical protein